ncbi:MAG: hypothetical protein ACJKTH_00570 [Patescibacteria group bacterium UBA2163]
MNKESISVWRGLEAFAGIVGVFTTLLLLDSVGDAEEWYDLLEDHDSAESLPELLFAEAGILGVMALSEVMHRITRN